MLKQIGYRCAVDFAPHEYRTREVELSIDRERPVLKRGASEKYVYRYSISRSIVEGTYGSDNGYFYEGVFNSNSPLDSTIRRPIYQGSTPNFFQYDIKQLVEVHP